MLIRKERIHSGTAPEITPKFLKCSLGILWATVLDTDKWGIIKHRDHNLVIQHMGSITDPQKNVLWLRLKLDWNFSLICDIGDQFAAALSKSPLQSTVGCSQRTKGWSVLSQTGKDHESAWFSPTKVGTAVYGLVMSTNICDPSANFHLEAGE